MQSSSKPAEVWFYHLTSSTLMQVLPPLLGQILKREWQCVVQTATPELMTSLDSDLWTFSDNHFIPHAKKGGTFLEQQAVYITDTPDDRPNTPNVILCVEAAPVPLDASVERIIVVFDAVKEAELTAARNLWKEVKSRDMPASYWTQTPSGGWEKKDV